METLTGRQVNHFLYFIFLLLPSLVHSTEWTGVNSCGYYQARGIVRLVKQIPVIVINEKSLSEIILSIPIKKEPLLAPYLNKAIEAKVKINKLHPANLLSGEILSIHDRVPDPLNPRDTGIKQERKTKCL